MSEHPPAWVVEHAQETSEAFNLPFHVALQRQLSWIEESFGMIPKEDPLREHKQKNADELQEITTMSDLEYEINDRFTVTLENLVDRNGNPCEFPVELSVTSPGHGDTVAQQLEHRMRLACYEAAREFDAEIDE